VLAAWSGLGYYARCRNLLRAARAARSRHGGIPDSLDALRELPGIGPYTAGAVASIAFAIPAAAVDGNVARVLSRLRLVTGDPKSPRVKSDLEALAAALVDPRRPGDWNQALMELGALVCRPRQPRCDRCPLASDCQARAAGREEEIPRRRARPEQVAMTLVLARVERGGRLLLRRAPEDALFPGMWGLPALVVPEGEDPAGFLGRRAPAELGVDLVVGEHLATVTRLLTHRRLELRVHAARLSGRPPGRGSGWGFTSEGEASSLPASTAMRRAIEASGGWMSAPRRDRGTKKVTEERRKALTSRGPTV
jgi:A/G-specific adenine glycosylase